MGGLSFFSEDMNNMVLASCAEITDQHNACCEHDTYTADRQLLNPAPGIEYDVDDMNDG